MAVIGKRFRKHHTRAKLHPAAIVAICLAAAVLLTVLTGNLLRLWLDDETYARLTRGEEESAELPVGADAKVRKINAYPFVLGDNVESAGGVPAVSVNLNSPLDGSMAYVSDTTAYYGLAGNEKVRLHESFAELSVYTPYISGVFYPQVFSDPLPDLIYAKGAQEAALLREFSRAGGSEIVLCGLPINESDISAVCEYVSLVSHAVGDTPVGVAVSVLDPALDEKWECLARLEQVCDFFVLDLRGAELDPEDIDDAGISSTAEALMKDCSYYFTAYSMRPMLSRSQVGLLSTLEARVYPNYQVLAD
ncbi:MAG: hypothetical protein IJZ80_00140 [Clostridia bacterium]|nr:hypothetical protein [Clostridia bacterium]